MNAPATLLLTEEQAAAQLQVCARTLRKARQQGRLRYVLIGKAIRYTLADLESFIALSLQEGQPCQQPTPRPKKAAAPARRAGDRVIVPFTQRRA